MEMTEVGKLTAKYKQLNTQKSQAEILKDKVETGKFKSCAICIDDTSFIVTCYDCVGQLLGNVISGLNTEMEAIENEFDDL